MQQRCVKGDTNGFFCSSIFHCNNMSCCFNEARASFFLPTVLLQTPHYKRHLNIVINGKSSFLFSVSDWKFLLVWLYFPVLQTILVSYSLNSHTKNT